LLDQADTVFGSGQEHNTADEAHLKDLHAKIGELALENAFFSQSARSLRRVDRKGGWMDTFYIERRWRSLKYEEAYLKAYYTVAQAKQGIEDWLVFYNEERRHASLSRMTLDQIYYDLPLGLPIAA
jgi:putative transposase